MKNIRTLAGFLLLLGAILLFFNIAQTSAHLAVISPNGGECLTALRSYTIKVEFDGERTALYYRTDGEKPTHFDASRIKYPLSGDSFIWTPQIRHISETGRIWIEELTEKDETKAWQSSAFDFVVRRSCPKDVNELAVIAIEAKLKAWQTITSKTNETERTLSEKTPSEAEMLRLLSNLYNFKNQIKALLASPKEWREPNLITKNLAPGVKDEEVEILQRVLLKFPEIYREGIVDGDFSSSTAEALKKFQTIFRIPEAERGQVESETRFRLNTLINSKVHVTTKDSEGGFNPSTITVEPGDVVRWFNNGFGESWPASDDHPTNAKYPERGGCVNSLFDSCRPIPPGESYYFVFNINGSWGYHDHLNPDLKGKITVK